MKLRKEIIQVLKNSGKEMRSREIASLIRRETIEVSVELCKMEMGGIVKRTTHNDFLNGESYYTWKIRG